MVVIDFILKHYVMILEIVGLWILLAISVNVSKRTIVLTSFATALLLLNTIAYDIEKYLSDLATLNVWRPILAQTIYVLYPAILFLTMQISAPVKKQYYWLVLIPEIVNIAVCYLSLWNGFVCSYSNDNHWRPGPLRYLPFIVFGFYIVVFMVQNFIYFKGYLIRDRVASFFIVFFAVVGATISWLQDETDSLNAIFAGAILLYYLFTYIHMSKVDQLTGLLNRQSFYRDIRIYSGIITAVASVDMNELKWINDTKGHFEGDNAIKAVAECLHCGARLRKTTYRIGGDEFAILFFGPDEEKVRNDVEEMRKQLARTDYSCAFGYAMKSEGENVENTLIRSDQKMYADKSAQKEAVIAGGGRLHRRKSDFLPDEPEQE
ncbi:MAG: GGDEF domain-containing protein [Clostridia bacterium]|nr:GGDEF domain-containing protein [Clostridia bacterium]